MKNIYKNPSNIVIYECVLRTSYMYIIWYVYRILYNQVIVMNGHGLQFMVKQMSVQWRIYNVQYNIKLAHIQRNQGNSHYKQNIQTIDSIKLPFDNKFITKSMTFSSTNPHTYPHNTQSVSILTSFFYYFKKHINFDTKKYGVSILCIYMQIDYT